MRKTGQSFAGLLLMLIGGFFLMRIWLPIEVQFNWALLLIGIGAGLLILAASSGIGGLAIGACVLIGLGAIFYYQIITDDWNSWAYLWTIIPGFIGAGILIASFINPRSKVDPAGFFLITLSLFGFLLFGGLFGRVSFFGMDITAYWPILLIVIGLFHLGWSWRQFISKS